MTRVRWLQEIREFEECAFNRTFLNMTSRKKAMTISARNCSDDNIRYILASSVDYIGKHPDWVKEAIWKARNHIETLIASGRQGIM